MTEGLGVTVLSVRLESKGEVSGKVGCLRVSRITKGLEVVWLQKVEPVGLMPGGYLDLWSGCLGGGTYSLGMML
jgi:hypothetical protein